MSDSDTSANYNPPAGGAYSTEEHLRAQAEQKSAQHPGVLVGDTDPTRESTTGTSAAPVESESDTPPDADGDTPDPAATGADTPPLGQG